MTISELPQGPNPLCEVCSIFQRKSRGDYAYRITYKRMEIMREEEIRLCFDHWHDAVTKNGLRDEFEGVEISDESMG